MRTNDGERSLLHSFDVITKILWIENPEKEELRRRRHVVSCLTENPAPKRNPPWHVQGFDLSGQQIVINKIESLTIVEKYHSNSSARGVSGLWPVMYHGYQSVQGGGSWNTAVLVRVYNLQYRWTDVSEYQKIFRNLRDSGRQELIKDKKISHTVVL